MKKLLLPFLCLSLSMSVAQSTFLKAPVIGTGQMTGHGTLLQSNNNHLTYFDIYAPSMVQTLGGGLMSVNSSGNLMWSKFYDDYYPASMVELGTNLYGVLEPGGSGSGLSIFKCNGANGNIMWNKYLTTSNPDYIQGPIINSIFAEGTGIAVFFERANTTLTNGRTIFYLKMDVNGNVTSSNLMDGYSIRRVFKDANGYTLTLNNWPGTDSYIMNIDQSMNINWMKKVTFPTAGTTLYSISKADGYYISGYRQATSEGFIIKLDFSGNPIWSRTIVSPSASVYGIDEIYHRNGYLYAATSTNSASAGMLKLDANGNILSYKYNSDLLNAWYSYTDSKQNADSTIFISGNYQDVNGNYPPFIMRTNVDGYLEACSHDSIPVSDSSFTYTMVNDFGVSPTAEATGTSNQVANNLAEAITMQNLYTKIDSVIVQPPTCSAACTGLGDVYVSGSDPNNSFSWFGPGGPMLSQNVSTLCVGSYTVEVLDNYSCLSNATITINAALPQTPSICMVTVDTLSDHNEIYWDKTGYANTDTFLVFRDTANNNYALIGRVPYDSLSQFNDTVRSLYAANGDPNVSSWRYKMAVKDNCGGTSLMSPYHQTLFIQNSTGNFSWNQYQIEGQPTPVPAMSGYECSRDDIANNNWAVVQTLSASSTAYTDPSYVTFAATADWRTSTIWTVACTPTLRTKGGNNSEMVLTKSRSNIKNNRVTGIKNVNQHVLVSVFPNPATSELSIVLAKECNNCSMQIVNTLGQTMMSEKLSSLENKISISNFENGIYYVKIISENKQTFLQKVIVQK